MVLKEKLEFLVSFDKLECGRKAFVLLIVDLFVVWVSHLLIIVVRTQNISLFITLFQFKQFNTSFAPLAL